MNKKMEHETLEAVTHTHTHGYSFKDMINTITLGNSYELIKYIPDKSIDLVIIDPPYLFDNFGGGCFGNERKKNRKELEKIRNGFDYSIIRRAKKNYEKNKYIYFLFKSTIKRFV